MMDEMLKFFASQVQKNRTNTYNLRNVTIEYTPVLQRERHINEGFKFNARRSSQSLLSSEQVKNLV